jgi:hypothetical protein
MEKTISRERTAKRPYAPHFWIGLALALGFWVVNWTLDGLRTVWAFFPMWLGYALVMDALALRRNGTSLLTRSWKGYIGLFLVSAPAWWLFEALNLRSQNWHYLGAEAFTPLQYFLLASINFSTVMPAVFGAAEWISGMGWVRGLGRGPVIRPDRRTTWGFFLAGWLMLALLLLRPGVFFPFVWLSVLFIIEPVNAWLGNRSLSAFSRHGDWRPMVSLWAGVLLTGFFWELWNYLSYPKWIYTVPGVGFWKVFEMPLLGYSGYLPFALELYALYHLVVGLLGWKKSRYLQFEPPRPE